MTSSCCSSDVTSLASTSARTTSEANNSNRAVETYKCWTSPRRTATTTRSLPPEDADSSAVLSTARQLIADLQDLLNDNSVHNSTKTKLKQQQEQLTQNRANHENSNNETNASFIASNKSTVGANSDMSARSQSQTFDSHKKLTQPQQQQQLETQLQETPLELQASNGLCVVFANYAKFLPASTVMSGKNYSCPSPTDGKFAQATTGIRQDDYLQEADGDAEEAEGSPRQLQSRANQIRDAASAIGRLFNSRLEFTVHIHWNKSRRETMRLLQQTSAAMSECARDCCFVFCLGSGGRDYFEAANGGAVTLTDILATLAVGQRGRLPPVFVIGELTPTLAGHASRESDNFISERSSVSTMDSISAATGPSSRLNLPSNHLLLWALGAPDMTDLLVEQLTKTNNTSGGFVSGPHSGNKDVASTVAGIAEWIRQRRRNTRETDVDKYDAAAQGVAGSQQQLHSKRCCCRFISKLDRLVYLASPDCF